MPAEQRGSPYRTDRGWGVRWYENGRRRHQSGFSSCSEALRWFDDEVRPRLRGLPASASADMTFDELADKYLAAHAATREASTIQTLTERLKRPRDAFGELTLRELERRALEVAEWGKTLPARSAYGVMQAFRQTLGAAARWGLMTRNPAKLAGPNPQPRREEVRPFEQADIAKLSAELGPWGSLVVFASETGLRPSEWIALEWRDIDRREGAAQVERTFSRGRLKGYGKTERSRRRVPLSARALEALELLPRRLNSQLVFPAPGGGGGVKAGTGSYLDLHNWRRREWAPAVEAAGLEARPPYALRHTFASHALAAGLSVFELARIMGTSVAMVDRTYGHLVKDSESRMRERLNAYATARLGVE